jgi:hypothetical protein
LVLVCTQNMWTVMAIGECRLLPLRARRAEVPLALPNA